MTDFELFKEDFIKKIFTLGKTERLKSRKIIEQVFNTGQSFNIFPFRVFYLYTQITTIPLQAGFGVSTKIFKKAVDRNRVKRLTREAYRLQKNKLQEILIQKKIQLAIFFVYCGKELPEYSLVSGKIGISLQRLINLVNEKPSTII